MSPHAQNAAIAGACGIKPSWFLMKQGLYYRPNAKGYTSDPAEAGHFSEAEANLNINPHDEPVTKHSVPVPDYGSDLNAIPDARRRYPFPEMDVGDSFFIPYGAEDKKRVCIRLSRAMLLQRIKKFMYLRVDGGVRCWRTK